MMVWTKRSIQEFGGIRQKEVTVSWYLATWLKKYQFFYLEDANIYSDEGKQANTSEQKLYQQVLLLL